MEKQKHPFDDFLKEAMKGHRMTPREEAKKAFLDEAAAVTPRRGAWFKWYYLALPVLLCISLAIWFYQDDRSASSVVTTVEMESLAAEYAADSPAEQPSVSSISSSSSFSSLLQTDSLLTEPSATQSIKSSSLSTSPVIASQTASPEINEPAGDITVNPVAEFPEAFDQPALNDSSGAVIITQDQVNLVAPEKQEQDNYVVPTVTGITTAADSLKFIKENPATPGTNRANPIPYFTASVYYLPEYMFNTVEDGKFVNNFGIDAAFYRGLVSIRTGVGISVSKGITENEVEYNSYLGTYDKLDSISFTFNEAIHNFEPEIFTSSEKVWDSIQQFDSTAVTKRYTYLQVPLILGFDFWQRGKFTAGVRVGTIMSVLLKTRQLTGEYDPGENQVVGMERFTPEQVDLNWQAVGGFNATARLSDKIFLEIEPQARYYYRSIYEKSDNMKKPWSVGVRAAVTYRF
jgi:hypothetical protein